MQAFVSDRRGNVVITFGLSAAVLLGGAGAALDYTYLAAAPD